MAQRTFAIFFLCLYSLVLVRPLLPIVDYSLHKDFIAKNLCENRYRPKLNCNGKCHLAKEIAKTQEQAGSDTAPVSKNTSLEENVHLGNGFSFNLAAQPALQLTHSLYKVQPLSSYSNGIFHPPCMA